MKLGNKELFIGLSMLTLAYFFALFKLQGVLFFLAVGVIFMTPICLMIHKLGFNMVERLLFSLFLGLGLFPSILYYLALVLGSITMAWLIVWLVLMVLGIIAYFKKGFIPSSA